MSLDTSLSVIVPEETSTQVDILDEVAKYIFTSKYSRYLPDKKRRETWIEAVERVRDMHLRKFSYLDPAELAEIEWAFYMVEQKRVLPSMRALQFAGPAIEAHEARQFNCSVRHIDSIRSFSEVFYLLLCGCGVGLGLSDRFLSRLPDLVGPQDRTGSVLAYTVEDSIEGWADSIQALLNCYFVNTGYSGRKIVFDYSKIRREGSEIRTGGGKAPGHEGLKATMAKIKSLLDRVIEQKAQKRLKTIDAYDILMHLADAVLSGGVRRSATSVVFDPSDLDMLTAKTGDWLAENPQRARSNNSVLLVRDETTLEEFEAIVRHTKEWGEPGFVFADDPRTLQNPCFEVSFLPVSEQNICAVQMCNLTSINGGKIRSTKDFIESARAAAIIGTLQASYTNFPYLGHASEELTKEEALLGVSITAMMESPAIVLDPGTQRAAAAEVVITNVRWAQLIGINPAARATVIKPEGTSTLAVGSMASGIHPAHAHKMFRRVQANKNDNVYRQFQATNPHLCEPSKWSAHGTDDVITFPVEVDPKALVKRDLSALEHLEIIKSTQENWVIPGTTEANQKPVHHNVSCTVIVGPGEWDEVISYLYENRGSFAAVSLLAASGDKDYAQAPNEAIRTSEEHEHFDKLLRWTTPVDYTQMNEDEDHTTLMQELACAGNQCEVR